MLYYWIFNKIRLKFLYFVETTMMRIVLTRGTTMYSFNKHSTGYKVYWRGREVHQPTLLIGLRYSCNFSIKNLLCYGLFEFGWNLMKFIIIHCTVHICFDLFMKNKKSFKTYEENDIVTDDFTKIDYNQKSIWKIKILFKTFCQLCHFITKDGLS